MRFLKPIIEVIREFGGSGTSSEVTDKVVERLKIPESEQSVILKSGQSRVYNQVHWGRMYLVSGGLLDSSERGVWTLTDEGTDTNLDTFDGLAFFKMVQKKQLLKVNKFVSFTVLFQCMRYQGSVSPSQVRDFRGAMEGRADKGIIITTGIFTVEAKKEARRDGAKPIELVNGDDLVDLFQSLGLGVTPRITYDVNQAFFDEYRKKV